jgi:hypothetical protein
MGQVLLEKQASSTTSSSSSNETPRKSTLSGPERPRFVPITHETMRPRNKAKRSKANLCHASGRFPPPPLPSRRRPRPLRRRRRSVDGALPRRDTSRWSPRPVARRPVENGGRPEVETSAPVSCDGRVVGGVSGGAASTKRTPLTSWSALVLVERAAVE